MSAGLVTRWGGGALHVSAQADSAADAAYARWRGWMTAIDAAAHLPAGAIPIAHVEVTRSDGGPATGENLELTAADASALSGPPDPATRGDVATMIRRAAAEGAPVASLSVLPYFGETIVLTLRPAAPASFTRDAAGMIGRILAGTAAARRAYFVRAVDAHGTTLVALGFAQGLAGMHGAGSGFAYVAAGLASDVTVGMPVHTCGTAFDRLLRCPQTGMRG
jgi:hypothetical protein